MKRAIVLTLTLILLMSVVSGISSEDSLDRYQWKTYKYGSGEYTLEVLDIENDKAMFMLENQVTPYLSKSESFKFEGKLEGFSVSVIDFFDLQGNLANLRVRFLLDVPTMKCGGSLCYPGEQCVKTYDDCYPASCDTYTMLCESYCGNGFCDAGEETSCKKDCAWCGDGTCSNTEHCGTCATDCGCDSTVGLSCVVDSCIQSDVEIIPVIEESSEPSIWDQLINWLKLLWL